MSKYCGFCGAQMDDSAVVCGKCGEKFPVAQTVKPTTSYVPPKASEKTPGVDKGKRNFDAKKIGAKLKKIAVAVIAIILISAVIKVTASFTGWRGTLRKTMKAYESFDMNTLCSVASDISYSSYSSGSGGGYSGSASSSEAEDRFEDMVVARLDSIESRVGHDPKISYKITDSYELDDRNRSSLLGQFEGNDVDISDISKVIKVELRLTVKGSKAKDAYDDAVYLVKESGDWHVYYPYN